MHRISDIYGPIVYTNFANTEGNYRPDTQQEAYDAFFRDLDEAAGILHEYAESRAKGPDIS